MSFFKSIFFCSTIWVLTALLNGVLSGIVMVAFDEVSNWPETFVIFFVLTMAFSIPGMFIFWLIMVSNWNKLRLFRSLLQGGFILTVVSCFLIFNVVVKIPFRQQSCFALSVVIAMIGSVMMHHRRIKLVSYPSIKYDDE